MKDIVQLVVYFGVLLALAPILGLYMNKVFNAEKTFMTPIMLPIERLVYKITGVSAQKEMNWKEYAAALLIFNALGFACLFAMQLWQRYLPLNPQQVGNVSPYLAFNTAVSFMTNTNWQAYSGESTLSYLIQMLGLNVQNFLSAATGIAVFLVLVRGFARKETKLLGNFWVDITRAVLYVFIPLAIIFAIFLVSQGVVQSLAPYKVVITLEGKEQIIPLGPAASQVAIKQLGTNGGGFFGTNSAHPFENPTPLANFFELLAILLIPMALVFTYARMIGSRRNGLTIFVAMFMIFLLGLTLMLVSEKMPNPVFGKTRLMEGKEVRFGITASILWGQATTCASNGSVNAMHDSFTPLAGMTALLNIMLGEIVFGGVGAGLYGMLMFVIITVFLAGLMVGRTPEYLGKKIEKREVQMAMLAIILPSSIILVFSAVAAVTNAGLAGLGNKGPHGLTEILYAFASAAGNNGSAFAGLGVDTSFYNILTGVGMLIGRFAVIIPAIAIGGSMAAKKKIPESSGTFRTDGMLFVILLIAVIIIVGALTFLPALCLGPIVEHILLQKGVVF